jgi:hypothetical protein
MNEHESATRPLDADERLCVDLACAGCGFNLRTLSVLDCCPHCYLRIAHSLRATLDADGRIGGDRPCLKCGYNLRSLSIAGRCPECGLPVAHSVRGDLLRYSDPDWVRQVANGAGLLDFARIPLVVALITVPLAMFLPPPATAFGYALRDGVRAVAGIASVATLLLVLVGPVVFTVPEPRVTMRREGVSARRVCRYSVLGAVVLLLLAILVVRAPAGVAVSLSVVFMLLLCAGYPLGFLVHLAGLSRRLPDGELARTAKATGMGVVALDVALVLPVLFELLVGGMSRVGLRFCWACIILPVGLYCVVIGFILVKRARDAFARAAQEAAANADAERA